MKYLKLLLGLVIVTITYLNANAQGWVIETSRASLPMEIKHHHSSLFMIDTTGRVWITSTASGSSQDFKLSVNGKIRAREIYVNNEAWADYVFEDDYVLLSFTELENYIYTNKHLPGIPNAAYIKENGLSVGETQQLMMEKIEELTLYIIRLHKEIEALKTSKK